MNWKSAILEKSLFAIGFRAFRHTGVGGWGGGSGYKKNRDRILRRNKKNRIRPRSGRNFWGFEVQKAVWGALESVKESGENDFFSRGFGADLY